MYIKRERERGLSLQCAPESRVWRNQMSVPVNHKNSKTCNGIYKEQREKSSYGIENDEGGNAENVES